MPFCGACGVDDMVGRIRHSLSLRQRVKAPWGDDVRGNRVRERGGGYAGRVRLLLPMLVLTVTDGGVAEEQRREILIAMSDCFDNDGGVRVQRIGECSVVCIGDEPTARLPDGGSCVPPFRIKDVGIAPAGDFWLPGQWPHSKTTPPWF